MIRSLLCFVSPQSWIEFTWNPLSSLERWLAVLGIILLFLITELNTFYLKFVLWWKPDHPFNFIRLFFMALWGAVGLRETFQLLDDPETDKVREKVLFLCKFELIVVKFKVGRQSWMLVAILVTECLICFKFGWETITKPIPSSITVWWLVGLGLLVLYTFVKFVVFKPTMLPKPEKEVKSPPKQSNGVEAKKTN